MPKELPTLFFPGIMLVFKLVHHGSCTVESATVRGSLFAESRRVVSRAHTVVSFFPFLEEYLHSSSFFSSFSLLALFLLLSTSPQLSARQLEHPSYRQTTVVRTFWIKHIDQQTAPQLFGVPSPWALQQFGYCAASVTSRWSSG